MRSLPLALAAALGFHLAVPPAARAQPFEPRDVSRGVAIPGGAGVAGDYDATAVSLNPAGLTSLQASSLAVIGTVLDEDHTLRGGGGWAGFLGIPVPILRTSIGFGWQSLSSPKSWVGPADPLNPGATLREDARQINTSFATGGRNFGFGLTYAHLFWDRSPQYQGLDTLHVGLFARPSRFFALGATVRDLFAPSGRIPQEKFERSYDLELALRPLGDDRLELGGGALLGEEDDGRVDPRGRALFRPLPGLTFYGQVDSVERRFDGPALPTARDTRLLFGLTVDTELVGASYSALASTRESGSGYDGSQVMLRLSGERYQSILAPARVVKLKLEGTPDEREFLHLLFALRRLEKQRGVRGVLFELEGYEPGWGKLEELRDEIARLRARGIKVFTYFRDAGTRQYYLATACDRIFVNPGGGLRLTGGASTNLYYKGLLDKLGVAVQVVKIAEYKSYPEVFTRTESSGPAREEREAYIRDILGRFAERVAAERHLEAARMRGLLERGPYLAPQALEQGLVDEVRYEDQLGEALRAVYGGPVALVDPPSAPARPVRWTAPHIALVEVEGDIVPGKSQSLPLWGHVTGGQSVAEAIKAARESPGVRAIVLRVNSPGGVAFAGEDIAREVELTRGKKPVVVSMGDVAASAGYMVSARGDRIFAEPSTITGSIGIFYYKPDLSGLLRLLGLTSETIKVGQHADMDSLYRAWTAEEEKIAFAGISYFYDRFIGMVADGRKLTKERVNEIGRGRVWTGGMAHPLGLVDQMGGLLDALAEAKRRAGLDEDAPIELLELPHEPENPIAKLISLVTEARGEPSGARSLPPLVRQAAQALPAALLFGERLVARAPVAEMP